MTLSRSNSFRSKAGSAPRISPFKDDSGLVAFRYEETKQAKPPIPLPPPRNPLRSYRPPSSATSNTSNTSNTSASIVITSPLVAPPQEDHPLFRTHLNRSNEWRRDSGAPTSSTLTVQGDAEDEYVCQKLGDVVYPVKPLFLVDKNPIEKPLIIVPKVSPSTVPSLDALPRPSPVAPELPVIPCQTELILPSVLDSPCTSPTDTRPESKMFRKSLSLSSSSGPPNRLRKRNASIPNDASKQPVSPSTASSKLHTWGSLRGPKSRKSPTAAGGPPPRPLHAKPESVGSRGSVSSSSFQQRDKAFMRLTTEIPSDIVLSEDLFEQLEFSKRGSIMFGAKRSQATSSPSSMQKPDDNARDATAAVPARAPAGDGASSTVPAIRVLAPDVERESQKVRSLYDSAENVDWHDGGPASMLVEQAQATVEDPSRGEQNDPYGFLDFNPVRTPFFGADRQDRFRQSGPSSPRSPSEGALLPTRTLITIPPSGTQRSVSSSSQLLDRHARGEFELAGGLEDWEDVSGDDVDRYGFITPKRPPRPDSLDTTPDDTHLSPTKRRGILALRPSSSGSPTPFGLRRTPTKKVSARSLNTQNTDSSAVSRRSAGTVVRRAANRLPHNRERRWMDEAGDMLNLSPGLDDIQEEELTGKLAEAAKRKELERVEKWRKMAKVSKGRGGEGMEFEFDTKNQKLVDRTWKGIPDRWRAAAWYSFLAASARNMGGKEKDEDLCSDFYRLQDRPSPDDVQIDLDVPRTINRHIMFRKRYKGGQRLLFRVLHALSLYFPDTGYVQGMASLAATLLCYFEEDKTFIMLVRMWRYRGLERLYQPGFAGLMTTLGDFEKHWLEGKDVARKLNDLGIDPTAYGTRWYLTLFNLSIPFPAQLRVWDVFMLLGECSPEPSASTPSTSTSKVPAPSKGKAVPLASHRGLDVLHATSAALIDALQEVLLDADFENAMKALTSWVPIKDEEMLMKVTRAEWKRHQSSRKPWDALRFD